MKKGLIICMSGIHVSFFMNAYCVTLKDNDFSSTANQPAYNYGVIDHESGGDAALLQSHYCFTSFPVTVPARMR